MTSSNENSFRELTLFNSIKLYPIALFITWFPSFLAVLLINAEVIGFKAIIVFLAYSFSTQNGSLLAIIYFSRSSVARLLWFNLLNRICLKMRYMLFGNQSTTHSRFSVMDTEEDARIIYAESLESNENVLVVQAMVKESNRLSNSIPETQLRELSVINIII